MRFRMNVEVDRLEVGDDGLAHETCWFCKRQIEFTLRDPTAGDVARVTISPLGDGEPVEGYCHRDCAVRAEGSLAF